MRQKLLWGNQGDHWPHHPQNKGEFGIKSSGEIRISSKCFREGTHYSLKCNKDLMRWGKSFVCRQYKGVAPCVAFKNLISQTIIEISTDSLLSVRNCLGNLFLYCYLMKLIDPKLTVNSVGGIGFTILNFWCRNYIFF